MHQEQECVPELTRELEDLQSSDPAGLEASWLAGWLACWPAWLGRLRRIGYLLEGGGRLERMAGLERLGRFVGIGALEANGLGDWLPVF